MRKKIVIIFIILSFIFGGCKDNPLVKFSTSDMGCDLQAVAGGSEYCNHD